MSVLNALRKTSYLMVGLTVVSCGQSTLEPSEDLSSTSQEVLSTNALSTNALSTNALSTNALSTNALSTNALSTNALSTNALMTSALLDKTLSSSGVSNGQNAAQIIKYSARCMLRPDQSVKVTYKKANGTQVTETYAGALGLAPGWATGSMTVAERRWWGACLGAHTNADGVAVNFSIRGARTELAATASEQTTYDAPEAAFWATYDPNRAQPLQIYGCTYAWANLGEVGAHGGCGNDGRFCADQTSCQQAINFVGTCQRSGAACRAGTTCVGTPTQTASTGQILSNGPVGSQVVTEVITTWVKACGMIQGRTLGGRAGGVSAVRVPGLRAVDGRLSDL